MSVLTWELIGVLVASALIGVPAAIWIDRERFWPLACAFCGSDEVKLPSDDTWFCFNCGEGGPLGSHFECRLVMDDEGTWA